MSDTDDIALLKELGVELEAEKPKSYTALEARLIAGFEDILRFYEEHKRVPEHGADNDIFERLYAVRLDRLRVNTQALDLLADMDNYGLLTGETKPAQDELNDEDILAELGQSLESEGRDITQLRHVSPVEHRKAAEEIANREVCRDFEKFEPLFEQVKKELELGLRETVDKTTQDDFDVGRFFILKGQIAFVADRGEDFKATGKNVFDARLRVVFDNGTESNLLMRSLQRSFNNPENKARAISNPNAGPLFSDDADNETGIIYVLRSKSDLPEIAPIRDAIVKIGVTGGSVKTRIANAAKEATYLLGEVEIVNEYILLNMNRSKLEKLLHRFFADAQLQVSIKDRFGNPFIPREWFLVTPSVVHEAVDAIKSGEITKMRYDAKQARIVKT